MAKEIERKFLVADGWSPSGIDGVPIRQGYLTDSGAGTEIRLRAHGERRLMTVKRSHGSTGVSVRDEVEFPLADEVFEDLWPLTEGARIAKLRYRIPLGDLTAEVDVYADRDDGLRVVEVEFASEADARVFQPPDWFGADVTGDRRYSNRLLAR